MAENDPNPNDPDPNAPAGDEVDTEAAALAVDMGGNKMVPLSALIAAKKEGKASRDRVKELEPIANRVTEVGGQLERAQPIINAIMASPKLMAEANRIAQGGTRPTADTTAQPDDPDLVQYAEDSGFYLADGVTPDAARANRVLTLLARRHGAQTDERIRPLAGVTLNSAAERNVQAAYNALDDDGTPYASKQSIDDVIKQMPRQMLADPQIANIILTQAIGMDRLMKRTAKAAEEPLYMERQGGSRHREAPLGADERAFLQRSGISEKEYRAAGQQLATGRGIELEK